MARRGRIFPIGDTVYRSRYERIQAQRLLDNNIKFQYEDTTLTYNSRVVSGSCSDCGSTNVIKARRYTPDFYFPETGIFVETKGLFDTENRKIMKEVCEQSDKDIRMVFMRDNYLTKKKKMKYSRWCEINNIKFAIGNIPLEWTTK